MNGKYDKTWYRSLVKPNFQPPGWIFAPVWTILYILMFVAFLLTVFAPFKPINIVAYVFFVAQLAVNLMWSPIFFKAHNLRKAFFVSFSLTLLVFLTVASYMYVSKLAALLMVPYLVWCVFATILSFVIWEINSD